MFAISLTYEVGIIGTILFIFGGIFLLLDYKQIKQQVKSSEDFKIMDWVVAVFLHCIMTAIGFGLIFIAIAIKEGVFNL